MQLARRVGDQRRAMPDRAQPDDGLQHLALAPTPPTRSIDVE
jgi:hypothetical protein